MNEDEEFKLNTLIMNRGKNGKALWFWLGDGTFGIHGARKTSKDTKE
jgi:hypothetical protein